MAVRAYQSRVGSDASILRPEESRVGMAHCQVDAQEVPLLKWGCGVPAVISCVSDRDSSALRGLQRLGLIPGACLVVEPGTRNASILIRIGGGNEPIR